MLPQGHSQLGADFGGVGRLTPRLANIADASRFTIV
jgi:hypothetical protein